MAQLAREAGLAAPEFESGGGEVVVRFRPTRYVAPSRVGHDLSVLQRGTLDVLAETGPASLKDLRERVQEQLGVDVPERTLQDNLQLLRHLELVELSGRGRGARWVIRDASRPTIAREPMAPN